MTTVPNKDAFIAGTPDAKAMDAKLSALSTIALDRLFSISFTVATLPGTEPANFVEAARYFKDYESFTDEDLITVHLGVALGLVIAAVTGNKT